jgi:diadenosine tetraphosphate (Ap4A) HIT family hydrolase
MKVFDCLLNRLKVKDHESMTNATKECPFCRFDAFIESEFVYVRMDKFPVSPGHCLIVPKRHLENWFEMTKEEQIEALELIRKTKNLLDQKFYPNGYNIGMDCGESAGQTIPHVRIHVIPRYVGDMPNPRDGVRGVIPEKQSY